MFGFLRNSKDNVSIKAPAETPKIDESAKDPGDPRDLFEQHQKPGSLFGGLEVRPGVEEGAASLPDSNFAMNSSFDFMKENSDTSLPSGADPASSFSFMSPAPAHEADTPSELEAASSFSFISSTGTSAFTDNEVGTSALHVSGPSSEPELLGPNSTFDQAPIAMKLSKTATAKTVKKKKRSSRVGFGREDTDSPDMQHPAPASLSADQTAAPSTPTSLSVLREELSEEGDGAAGAVSAAEGVQVAEEAMLHSYSDNAGEQDAATFMSELSQGTAEPEQQPSAVITENIDPEDVQLRPNALGGRSSLSVDVHIMATDSRVEGIVEDVPRPVSPMPSFPPPPPPLPLHADMDMREEISGDPYAEIGEQSSGPGAPSFVNNSAGDVPCVQQVNEVPAVVNERSLASKRVAALGVQIQTFATLQMDTARLALALRKELRDAREENQRARLELATSEAEQGRFAQIEEFEKADALSAVIQEHRSTIARSERIMQSRSEELAVLRAEFEGKVAEQENMFSGIVTALCGERALVADRLFSSKQLLSRRRENGDARIQSEVDRLRIERRHIAREEEALAGDAAITEDAIGKQCVGLETQRTDVDVGLLSLQAEIRSIEELLATKRREEAQMLKERELLDNSIDDIRKKYSRQLQRIQERRRVLEQSSAECLEEVSAISLERSSLLHELQSIRADIGGDCLLAASLRVEIDAARKISDHASCATQQDSFLMLMTSGGGDSSDGLEERVQALSAQADMAESELTEAEGIAASMAAAIQAIDDQLPKLEAEKKAHASTKRFKEAATVAKEIKEAVAQRDIFVSQLQSAQEEVAVAKAHRTQCQEDLETGRLQLQEARREGDIRRLEALSTLLRKLTSLLASLRRTAADVERRQEELLALPTAPLQACELAVTKHSIQLLEDELGAVQTEIRYIRSLHGLQGDELQQPCVADSSSLDGAGNREHTASSASDEADNDEMEFALDEFAPEHLLELSAIDLEPPAVGEVEAPLGAVDPVETTTLLSIGGPTSEQHEFQREEGGIQLSAAGDQAEETDMEECEQPQYSAQYLTSSQSSTFIPVNDAPANTGGSHTLVETSGSNRSDDVPCEERTIGLPVKDGEEESGEEISAAAGGPSALLPYAGNSEDPEAPSPTTATAAVAALDVGEDGLSEDHGGELAAVFKDDVVGSMIALENKDELILQAKALAAKVDEMESELNESTEREDYDTAAEIFDAMNEKLEELEQLLKQLGMSKEQLLATAESQQQSS